MKAFFLFKILFQLYSYPLSFSVEKYDPKQRCFMEWKFNNTKSVVPIQTFLEVTHIWTNLCRSDRDQESLTMQFGRVDQTSFSFDAASPLSPLQAGPGPVDKPPNKDWSQICVLTFQCLRASFLT